VAAAWSVLCSIGTYISIVVVQLVIVSSGRLISLRPPTIVEIILSFRRRTFCFAHFDENAFVSVPPSFPSLRFYVPGGAAAAISVRVAFSTSIIIDAPERLIIIAPRRRRIVFSLAVDGQHDARIGLWAAFKFAFVVFRVRRRRVTAVRGTCARRVHMSVSASITNVPPFFFYATKNVFRRSVIYIYILQLLL